MRAVHVPEQLLESVRRHARETYPDECCGFLIAAPDPSPPESPRNIVEIERAENRFDGERRRRFVIRPEELRARERHVGATGRIVAGFYHSHPDHEARPSTFDQEHAWPWYSYLVLAVSSQGAGEVGAFELDADAAVFRRVPLISGTPDVAGVTESLSAPMGR
jgi:proteasome lid subunit RPN8/RPN11